MNPRGTWAGRAPAKVNLRLQILTREVSGYHQIETVFQALDLADRIELVPREDGQITLAVTGLGAGDLGPPEWNLAVQAARRFAEAFTVAGGGEFSGVGIRLGKQIPAGAGLGGGSSDAATVLRGLNELSEAGFSASELVLLSAELGSDVPFFASGASRALAWGRGDRILPLSPLPVRHVLLAVPAQPIETGWAYGALAEHREDQTRIGPLAGLLDGDLRGGWDAVAVRARNEFEPAIFPLRPDLPRIKRALVRVGARPALLSGSGSALFGVFEDEGELEAARGELEKSEPGLRLLSTRTASDESE